jgi:SAM-dependent methyltransferase
MKRVEGREFERMYARESDPWGLGSSEYERGKRAETVAALGSGRHDRALEVGCATGELTAALAALCEHLVACDFSPFAVAATRRRVAVLDNVEVILATFPEQISPHSWQLVVCSEVLYYLDAPAFSAATAWLGRALASGATVLAVHWRGPGITEPQRGDDVHDRLAVELRRWHVLDRRQREYRLDRFDGGGEAKTSDA